MTAQDGVASEDDDRRWVAEVTGATVDRFERTTAGRSRATWLVEATRADGSKLDLVLRRDTGDGPLSGTELDLAREALVYRALGATDVPVPDLLAVAPDGRALLVTRVEGGEDLTTLGRDALVTVSDSFIDALAALHNVDVDGLDLPGFARPSTPAEHATADIALWRRILDGHVTRPAPVFRLAFDWLERNAPTDPVRTVLCHGDLGPGNFLHDGTKLTALLDWEFAHLGDPMDDLAWLTMRTAQVAQLADFDAAIRRYAAATGIAVDPGRVGYYQVLVLTRMAVACLVALSKRGGQMDTATYLALLPLLERQVTRLLIERTGLELAPYSLPPAAPSSPRAEVLEVLAIDLGSVLMPELQTAAARARAMSMTLLLMHLQAADTLGAGIDAEERDDLTALLGAEPASTIAGLQAVDDLIRAGAYDRFEELLGYFDRRSTRNIALWPIIAGMAERSLPNPPEIP